jgi:hypothetical protein
MQDPARSLKLSTVLATHELALCITYEAIQGALREVCMLFPPVLLCSSRNEHLWQMLATSDCFFLVNAECFLSGAQRHETWEANAQVSVFTVLRVAR